MDKREGAVKSYLRPIISAALTAAVLFGMAGCTVNYLPDKEMLVETLAKTYPDDRFTLEEFTPTGIAVVSSENYPGRHITVQQDEDGVIISDYPVCLYEEDVAELFAGLVYDHLKYDSASVQWTLGHFPVEDISEEEFFREYVYGYVTIRMHYSSVEDTPLNDDLTAGVVQIVDELDAPCELHFELNCGASPYMTYTLCDVVADEADHIEALDITNTRLIYSEEA